MSGGEFLAEGRSILDLLVPITVVLGATSAFAGVFYRYVKNRLSQSIKEQVAPVEDKVDKMLIKVDDLKMETIKGIQVKEELDRERFRNIHNGQEHIKEQLKESIINTEDTKKKLEGHLVEAATFIGRTETKISGIETALHNFRSFMRHTEADTRNNNNNFTS